MSVYKSFVLNMDVSVFKDLCHTCKCPSTRALCWTWTCLSSRTCATLVSVRLQELCDASCNWMCLSTRACAAPVIVCLHARVLCGTAAPGRVCLQEPSQCCPCRCTVYKIHVRNNETNCNKPKTTETDWVSALFDSSWKYFFFVSITLYSKPSPHHYPEM